jgi:hypothetical protein
VVDQTMQPTTASYGFDISKATLTWHVSAGMPSRDPHYDAHHEILRSRPLHQSRWAGAWWLVRVRRAELLRICCAKWLERRGGALGPSGHARICAISLTVDIARLAARTQRASFGLSRNQWGRKSLRYQRRHCSMCFASFTDCEGGPKHTDMSFSRLVSCLESCRDRHEE